MAIEKVLQEALALPAKERNELASALLRSIEPDDAEVLTEEEWEKAWAAELNRRMKEIDEGRAELIPHEQVFTELLSRFLRGPAGGTSLSARAEISSLDRPESQ